MPEPVSKPTREATRKTIIEDRVPAPPLPEQSALPGMTPPPGEDFDAFTFFASLRPNDWANYMVYLYWSPPGQRRLGPYIDVITEAVTMEWVRKNFGGSGGGRFILWVNHTGEPPWRKTHEFEIEGDRIFKGQVTPPAGQRPADPTAPNELLGLLKELLSKPVATEQNAQAALDMTRKAYQDSLEVITKQTATPAGGGLIEAIRLLKELGILAIPGQSAGGGLLDTIRTLKELGLMGATAAATDPLKTLDTVSALIERVKALAPDSETGADWKAALVKVAGDLLPMIPKITDDLAKAGQFNARAAELSQRPAPPSPSVSSNQSQNPSTTPPPNQPAQDARASANEVPKPAANEAPAGAFDIQDYLWSRAAQMIAQDADGDMIAQWLHFSTMGPDPDDPTQSVSLVANFAEFTPGGLLLMLKTKPAIAAALETPTAEGKPRDLEQLAKEFLHFCKTGEMWPDDETEEFEPRRALGIGGQS